MWIRSQSKLTLQNVKRFVIEQFKIGIYIVGDGCTLGVYSTKEKDLDEFEKEFGFKLLPTSFKKPLSEITKEEYRERIEYVRNAIINDNSNEEDDF